MTTQSKLHLAGFRCLDYDWPEKLEGSLFRLRNEPDVIWQVVKRQPFRAEVRLYSPIGSGLTFYKDVDEMRNIHYVWYEPEKR